jgi:lipoprotein-anchoring transpeptidase ErfK/SrfK
MTGVSGHRASGAAVKLCQIVVLAAAGAIGTTSQAQAALYYWSDFDPGYYQPRPMVSQRWQKPRRPHARKIQPPGKEAAKPQGPLIIAISIDRQRLKIYDANGFFAETPVSTGMKGHSTPMGVFSVIQKHKWHRSNIYSDAPMPYMQRITWSGVAIHAGVLPGYPASHGCIRMPTAFAIKMWNWTRMGARVVITPGEISPASFSHPLLAAQRVVPQPAAGELQTDAPAAPKSDKASDAAITPAASQASLELRSTVGHAASVNPGGGEPSASAAFREQTHTADASALPEIKPGKKPVEAMAMKLAEKAEVRPDHIQAAAADTQKLAGKPEDAAGAGSDINATPAPKDQGRMPETAKPSASQPDPAVAPRRRGQIAVLISRKDSKLYVRENLAPLFDAPVTIAPDDRPLGTHVFTAQVDRNDANVLHWSVVSLPGTARQAVRRDEEENPWRRRKVAVAAEVKPLPQPDSPSEALDRLTIPADAMARITEALSTGGSIIVSDQGINTGETGEGTDFIVPLR